jgi:hypothetical protein
MLFPSCPKVLSQLLILLVDIDNIREIDVEVFDDDVMFNGNPYYNSSTLYIPFILNRNPYYYSVNIMITSCIYVLLAYCSFWINKKAMVARTFLTILTVYISFEVDASVSMYLPPSDQRTWLGEY